MDSLIKVTNSNTKTNNGILVLDNNKPEDVARALIESDRQKEPFFLFDMDEAFHRIELFRTSMPRVQIFFAMKTNSSINLIKLVAAAGLGFDCASPREINKILNLNVSPNSIIFAVPNKAPEWMSFARESGVRHTTFHSSYELKKIKQYWPDSRLLIRIKADGDSVHKLDEKFGCDFETEAFALLEQAATLGLKVVGVAFHVGSVCLSTASYVTALNQARSLFNYEAKAGRKMNVVDIGGGFMMDGTNSFEKISITINGVLDELFPDPAVQIISEPGRYVCDTAFSLYCNINDVRRVTREGEIVNMIYLNDGPFGSLRYIEPWYTVRKFEKSSNIKNENLEKTILWGPTCSTDRIMENLDIQLPRCSPLDWLVFKSQGAYSLAFGSTFSSLKSPRIRSVMSRQLWDKMKQSKIFESEDFVLNPDISTPLPSTLPSLVKKKNCRYSNFTLQG